MSIQTEAKRVKAGQSLTTMQNQAINMIAQLEGLKANLIGLKTTLEADNNFDINDIGEVQTIINDLASRIQAIL